MQVGRNGTGKTTLLRALAGHQIKGIPFNMQVTVLSGLCLCLCLSFTPLHDGAASSTGGSPGQGHPPQHAGAPLTASSALVWSTLELVTVTYERLPPPLLSICWRPTRPRPAPLPPQREIRFSLRFPSVSATVTPFQHGCLLRSGFSTGRWLPCCKESRRSSQRKPRAAGDVTPMQPHSLQGRSHEFAPGICVAGAACVEQEIVGDDSAATETSRQCNCCASLV